MGCAGRGGKSGKSITFFTGDAHERALYGELAQVLRENGFEAECLKKFPMMEPKPEAPARLPHVPALRRIKPLSSCARPSAAARSVVFGSSAKTGTSRV